MQALGFLLEHYICLTDIVHRITVWAGYNHSATRKRNGFTARNGQENYARIQDRALVKLLMLDASETIDDLRMPPSNKFEKLAGSLAGKYSIRINNQWRILFRITEAGFFDVSIVDYH